jgi:hypothetical protein
MDKLTQLDHLPAQPADNAPVESNPQPREVVVHRVSPKPCDHPAPAEMQAVGPELGKTCPSCLIDRYVFDAQDIQKGIERRGGIFDSKYDPTTTPDNFGHRNYIKIWRTFRIRCSKDIDTLEQLQAALPEVAEEWGVKSALDRWEIALDELSHVPGGNYVETEKAEQDCPAESTDSTSSEDEETSVDLSNITGSKQDESEDISDQLIRQLNLWNILPFATLEDESSPVSAHRKPSSTSIDAVSKPTTSSHQTAPLPRSALKGSRATVCPTSTIITHPSHPLYTNPHNKHTIAESARPRLTFQRTSIEYRAALWSSSPGYVKEDTSGSSMSWYKYEKVHQTGVFEVGEGVQEQVDWDRGRTQDREFEAGLPTWKQNAVV